LSPRLRAAASPRATSPRRWHPRRHVAASLASTSPVAASQVATLRRTIGVLRCTIPIIAIMSNYVLSVINGLAEISAKRRIGAIQNTTSSG
jgi:hypothetical protein